MEERGILVKGQETEASNTKKKFSERENKGKIEDILNPNIPAYKNSANIFKRCEINLIPDNQVDNYRYMYQKRVLEELDDRFSNLSSLLKGHYNLEISDAFHINRDEIHTVGRICCDSEGNLNTESVLLEIPEKRNRLKLSFDGLKSFSLFSGQILGVEGTNSTGNYLNMSRIFEIPLLPMCKTPSSELIEYNYGQEKQNGNPLNIVIAAGPFTLNDGFEYEPFKELLSKMNQEKPDLLILLGPFVSEDHPLLYAGNTSKTPGEIFKKSIIDELCKVPNVSIVLVPSIKDLIHPFVFPQSPFPKHVLSKNVICVSNPAQFRVNEITFAIDNVDILFHLINNEIERIDGNAKPSLDRMGRLSRHILTQRQEEVHLEFKKSSYLELKQLPDVLILPSKLKSFAKVVENVICVNPGYLSRGESGGTYSKMTIHPLPKTLIEKDQFIENLVFKRTRVEIIKI
ncbi:20171_t:CDS:10 [Funneliformis geosporum]|nr:20171_t:CDS:10 [Funneliformis geosporum]